MTARITGFVSRADAGLARPRSVSRNITPDQGGVALHYGGPAQRITDHARCLRVWRDWQRYHVEVKGWVDLAYTGGACDHGYAFAGRGAGVRTAANGTNAGNDDYYAVVWLGGAGETPTALALDAFDWWVDQLRRHGAAGRRVVPHKLLRSTECPGPELVRHAAQLDKHDVPTAPTPAPAPPPVPAGGPVMAALIKTADKSAVYGTDGAGHRWHVPSQEVLNDLRATGIYGDGRIHIVSDATINSLVLVERPA